MKKTVAIIGGGPAAMAVAGFLDPTLFDVTIYEKNKSIGRKFLVAGKGGFNLTFFEETKDLIERYYPKDFLSNCINYFDNKKLRTWLDQVGIPTYVGSSKRVFPIIGIKPIEVLKKILVELQTNNVSIKFKHHWIGWDQQDNLKFSNGEVVQADIVIFSLGGGSWKVTGSDGIWLDVFNQKGITTKPFISSNCAFEIDWNNEFLDQHSGHPLKNIELSCNSIYKKGELVITDFGLEGNAIYALSLEIQSQLKSHGKAKIYLDLKPSYTQETILQKIETSSKKISQFLKEDLNLSRTQLRLLKSTLTKEEFLNPAILASSIKALQLTVLSAAELDEAISTTGGISLEQVDSNFMLSTLQNQYCIGEMLDWNAPTGGYLLQACFSMGAYLANNLNQQYKIEL